MDANTIGCICVGAAGLVAALLSLPFFMRGRSLRRRCTAETVGKVIKHRIAGGSNAKSVAPVAEFSVNGRTYTAYRHYKGVVSTNISTPEMEKVFGQGDGFYISENDIFHIHTTGIYHNYRVLGEQVWHIGSDVKVIYDPKKPKCAYIDKVVTSAKTAGIVLLSCGAGLMLISAIAYLLI